MFRADDVTCRWGGEEVALGMYGMSRRDGVTRVAEALGAFSRQSFEGSGGQTFQVTFSAGVSEYGPDGADLRAVYHSADQVLYRAKAQGGARVLPAGWTPDSLADAEPPSASGRPPARCAPASKG